MKNKLITLLVSLSLIVQTSNTSTTATPSMNYPIPNGFMHLLLNDLLYYVTSSTNSINLAYLDSKLTGTATGAALLASAKACGKSRYEANTLASATVTDSYGNKTYTTVGSADLTFNNTLISGQDLANRLLNNTCVSAPVKSRPCEPSAAQCTGAGATYTNNKCTITTSAQCTKIGGSWDGSSCNCTTQSSAIGEKFQRNVFINNNYNNRIWNNNVCLAIASQASCTNNIYGNLSWNGSSCTGTEAACQLQVLGYLPLDTLVRSLPAQVAKAGNTTTAYQQFMQSLAQNPFVQRFVYSLVSDINWVTQWSNSLLASSIGTDFSSTGGSAVTNASAQRNATTLLPYLIKPSASSSSQTLTATYLTPETPLFSGPTNNSNYYSLINPAYFSNNTDAPNSVLPTNFKFTNLTYPTSYVSITNSNGALDYPINQESFNYCNYRNALNQKNCIMLSQTGIPFGMSQPNNGLKSLLLANIASANPVNPLWTDAYCDYSRSNNPDIYDTDKCQTVAQQFQAYWGLLSGVFFLLPSLKEGINSFREWRHGKTKIGKKETALKNAKENLADRMKTREVRTARVERMERLRTEYDAKIESVKKQIEAKNEAIAKNEAEDTNTDSLVREKTELEAKLNKLEKAQVEVEDAYNKAREEEREAGVAEKEAADKVETTNKELEEIKPKGE